MNDSDVKPKYPDWLVWTFAAGMLLVATGLVGIFAVVPFVSNIWWGVTASWLLLLGSAVVLFSLAKGEHIANRENKEGSDR
jgi:hypothetical protein